MGKEPQPFDGFEEPKPANPRRTATLIAIVGAVIILVAFFSGSWYDSQTTQLFVTVFPIVFIGATGLTFAFTRSLKYTWAVYGALLLALGVPWVLFITVGSQFDQTTMVFGLMLGVLAALGYCVLSALLVAFLMLPLWRPR